MDEYSTPEFYKSTKQKDKLSYRGYRYHRARVNGDREYWKCEDRSCRGRAVTNKREIVSVSEHAHGPNQAETVIQKAVCSIKSSSETEFAILRRRTDVWLWQSSTFSDDI